MKVVTFEQNVSISPPIHTFYQGVTKRCRLPWLTNGALVSEPKCGGGV